MASLSRVLARAYVLIAALVLVFPADARAQSDDLSPFSVARLDASARAAALGGSLGAATGSDVTAFFYNPAGLDASMDGNLALTYLRHIGGLNAGFLAYGLDVDGVATFAGGLRFLSWGSVPSADADGNETGSFGAGDAVLSIGASTEYVDGVRLGATVHGFFSAIESHRATALAADAGVIWTPVEGRTAFGLSLHNVGFVTASLGIEKDQLPLDLRFNVSHRLEHLPLLVSVSAHQLQAPGRSSDEHSGLSSAMRHLAFGGEFQFSEAFNLRFGYNHRRHQDLKMNARLDMAGVGLGFGLKVHRFFLDYAFNSWSTLGGLHQLTVRTTI